MIDEAGTDLVGSMRSALDKLSKEASTLEKAVESAAAAMDVVRLRQICDRLDQIAKECSVAFADAMSTIERRAEAAKGGRRRV